MHAAAAEADNRDRDIVELIRQSDRTGAFEELLRRYQDKVYHLCCALLGERTQAEDAAQDSLVRIWQALDRYDGRASLSSWIYAITRNRCLSALQRRRRLQALETSQETPTEVPALVTQAEAWDGRAQQLRELVERLPERLRHVLRLYYYEERSVAEVALMLGCPQGTVKTNLFRARAALAEMLKRSGLNDPAYWAQEHS